MIDPQPPRAWTSDCLVIGDTWSGCGWEPAHPDLACLDSRPSSDRCKAFALQLVLGRANTFIRYSPSLRRCAAWFPARERPAWIAGRSRPLQAVPACSLDITGLIDQPSERRHGPPRTPAAGRSGGEEETVTGVVDGRRGDRPAVAGDGEECARQDEAGDAPRLGGDRAHGDEGPHRVSDDERPARCFGSEEPAEERGVEDGAAAATRSGCGSALDYEHATAPGERGRHAVEARRRTSQTRDRDERRVRRARPHPGPHAYADIEQHVSRCGHGGGAPGPGGPPGGVVAGGGGGGGGRG